MLKKIRRDNGFTLIEALASVAILSVFVSAMIGLLGQSILYSKLDMQREIARSYAVTQISNLLSNPQASLNAIGAGYDSPANLYTPPNSPVTGPDGVEYSLQEYMSSSVDSNGGTKFTVGVTVSWGPSSAKRSLSLVRFFYV